METKTAIKAPILGVDFQCIDYCSSIFYYLIPLADRARFVVAIDQCENICFATFSGISTQWVRRSFPHSNL